MNKGLATSRQAPLPFCAHHRPLFLRTTQQKNKTKSGFELVKFRRSHQTSQKRNRSKGDPTNNQHKKSPPN